MNAVPPVSIEEPPTGTPLGPGPDDGQQPVDPLPVKRNSIFPLMVDVGAVFALFGLIIGLPLWGSIVGGGMVGVGILIAVTGLTGWLVEARSDFRRMPD